MSLVEKLEPNVMKEAVDGTGAGCVDMPSPAQPVEVDNKEAKQADLLDFDFDFPSTEPIATEPIDLVFNIENRLQRLSKQNEILMRLFAAPHYRALASKIFRKVSLFHMHSVGQLFRKKGYGEDWLTVVTSALGGASSAVGDVTLVSSDASLDADVQRAVVDFPYSVDMARPLSQREVGDPDRVIYDIFLLYEELKPFCK